MGKRRKVDVTTSAEPVVPCDQKGMVLLHRARFVEWQPSAVVALTSSDDGSLTVAARENGDVELYDVSNFQLLRRIPGHVDASPTSIALVASDEKSVEGCRLFTAGLDGTIVEYDLENCCSASITDGNGGAIWSVALSPGSKSQSQPQPQPQPTSEAIPNGVGHRSVPYKEPHNDADNNSSSSSDENEDEQNTHDGLSGQNSPQKSSILAAACDDGSVKLFTVEYGLPGVVYSKSLPRVEGRTLAVAWHPSAEFLVSGGTDGCIHVWEVASGREVLRITVGDGTGREVCIWSLLVLPDGSIVSGDSVGNVCFWDGRFGTLISRFDRHAADVLAMAASPDGSVVFAAGVDPQIGVFKKLKGGTSGPDSQSWAFLSAKRTHTHDVRAMCISQHGIHTQIKGGGDPTGGLGGTLFTGSNDTQLFAHSVDRFLKQHPLPVNSCPQPPLFGAGMMKWPWLLVANRNEVDIWKLAGPPRDTTQGVVGNGLTPPHAVQKHLVHLVNRSGDYINAVACSPGGEYIAFSDTKSLRCLKVSLDHEDLGGGEDDRVTVSTVALQPLSDASKRQRTPKGSFPPASFLVFRPGHPSVLIAVAPDGLIRIVDASYPERHTTIRDLHDLRFKMWYKRDRSRSQARRLAPAVALCEVRNDGKWFAAVVRNRIYLLDLDTNKITSQILFSGSYSEHRSISNATSGTATTPLVPGNEHITSIAFSKWNGAHVILACTARNYISMYDCATGQPTAWTMKYPANLMPLRLANFPGPITGMVAIPKDEDENEVEDEKEATVLLYSSHAFCHIDFSAPLSTDAVSGRELTAAEKRAKRRREYEEKQREGYEEMGSSAGENCRVLRNVNPILHAAKVGDREVVVVERSWAEVMARIAAPMYRHRFGT